MKKTLIVILILLLIVLFLWLFWQGYAGLSKNTTDNTQVLYTKDGNSAKPEATIESLLKNSLSKVAEAQITTLLTTGDVIPARSVNTQVLKNKDFKWPYLNTAQITSSADITVINLEAPLIKNCPVSDSGFTFCGDTGNVDGLVFAGVDVATLANNHIYNYGTEGLNETVSLLDSKKIKSVVENVPTEATVKDTEFIFLAYDVLQKSFDKAKAFKTISNLSSPDTFLVVSFHWGAEYQDMPAQETVNLAHRAVDNGADLILGNHPHWIQPLELYKGKVISYAQGNYIFDQMWSEETKTGILYKFFIKGEDVVAIEPTPIYIQNYGQAILPEPQKYENILSRVLDLSLKLSSYPTYPVSNP